MCFASAVALHLRPVRHSRGPPIALFPYLRCVSLSFSAAPRSHQRVRLGAAPWRVPARRAHLWRPTVQTDVRAGRRGYTPPAQVDTIVEGPCPPYVRDSPWLMLQGKDPQRVDPRDPREGFSTS